jgi:tRNA A37 threonylcarbamoyladenosine synthetase subunit TsaC/SUA5/YrdC
LHEVDASLLERCDLALDAGAVSGLASSVIDLSRYAATGRWCLLRAGAWAEAEVAARLAGTREEPPLP